MGIELKNKVLCTLKLTQKLFEDLPSYSLSFLCGHLGIPCKDRHRSLPDALLLFELMQQLMPILDARTQQQLHLPKHRKMLAKIPQLPGVAKINGQAGINFYSCENLYHWLSQHLALKWENKEYINSINQIDFYLTGSFMASCLKRPAQEKPKFVIYQFQDKSGLIRLGQGPYIKNKKALLYFKDKQSCRQRFEQIQNELSRSNSAPIKDKTSIVRHNLELQQVLSKFIPNESNLLFRSTRPIQNKYVYVHIKDQQYFAIFESETAIQKKNELPGLKYRVLGPQNYMQFLQGWQVIRNQRIKTDLILNF